MSHIPGILFALWLIIGLGREGLGVEPKTRLADDGKRVSNAMDVAFQAGGRI
jgi:hypothetical protein